MPIPQEAMTVEEYQRWDRGLPPLKKKVKSRPEPESPEVENLIKFNEIDDIISLESAKRNILYNKDGISFLGFDVVIKAIMTLPRGPGRPPKDAPEPPKEEKVLAGWMSEGDFHKLIRAFRKKIDMSVIHW